MLHNVIENGTIWQKYTVITLKEILQSDRIQIFKFFTKKATWQLKKRIISHRNRPLLKKRRIIVNICTVPVIHLTYGAINQMGIKYLSWQTLIGL